MSTVTIILLVVLGIVVFWSVGIYNNLVSLKHRFQNAFAQIDVQLKRRYDLIPNLVETAKAYMTHERETLEAVIAARNTAASANDKVASNPADSTAMRGLLGAETALQGAMSKFFALMENYPDLKANQNMMQVSEELTSTENKVAFARQAFNDAVTQYNIATETFPSVIVARAFAFLPAQLFEITAPAERDAVKVSFS